MFPKVNNEEPTTVAAARLNAKSNQLISDMYTLKRAGASSVMKPTEKRTAISKLLSPEQLDMFN
jgi:hypothetical protein